MQVFFIPSTRVQQTYGSCLRVIGWIYDTVSASVLISFCRTGKSETNRDKHRIDIVQCKTEVITFDAIHMYMNII